jgi:hypothetical protein
MKFSGLLLLASTALAHPLVSMSEPTLIKEEVSLCSPCLSISESGINTLLNYILNAGVIGGCGKLCGSLKSKDAATVCEIACAVVGIKEFVSIIQKADLDPFYFCEEVKMCPEGKDDAAGSIVNIVSTPPTGPAGTKFALELQFNIANATGVGEIRIAVKGPGDTDISQSFPNTGFAAGNYQSTVTLDTTPNQQADPPVIFPSGAYDVEFVVCQGECGSKHPHSIIIDDKHGNFTVA